MAEIDPEVVARVARWCAEAGRTAGSAAIRAALARLSWDELLAVKALLADPPPARPLGPFALADLARGTPAEVAAGRQRDGLYRAAEEAASAGATPEPEPAPAPADAPPPPKRSRARKRSAAIVVRRARDRVPAAEPAPPALPALDALLAPEGRAVLERLIRRAGGRRAALRGLLADGWRRADGAAPGDAELSALLETHGLARTYARREHDELLHAMRAASGVRARAARAIGIDVATLDADLARVGAAGEAERIRDARRRELRARATLSERVQLLLQDEERLADLGLLAEFEADLRSRLPEHLRALRAGDEPLPVSLGRSLSLPRPAVDAIAARFGLALEGARADRRPGGDRPRGDRPRGDRPRGDLPRGDRPRGDRPRGDRPRGDRPSGDRPRGDRPRGDRPRGDRPRDDRPRGDRPRGDRPRGDRPRTERPGGDRRPPGASPGPRSAGPRPSGPRSGAPRSAGPRPAGPRSGAPRSGPRPAAPRGGGGRGGPSRPPRGGRTR